MFHCFGCFCENGRVGLQEGSIGEIETNQSAVEGKTDAIGK